MYTVETQAYRHEQIDRRNKQKSFKEAKNLRKRKAYELKKQGKPSIIHSIIFIIFLLLILNTN
jgi:hypothetical protein